MARDVCIINRMYTVYIVHFICIIVCFNGGSVFPAGQSVSVGIYWTGRGEKIWISGEPCFMLVLGTTPCDEMGHKQ